MPATTCLTDVQTAPPPQALVIPVASFDEPFFVHERDTLLLPCTAEWRDVAEACRHRVIKLPTPAGGVKLYACRNSPTLAQLMNGAGIEIPSPILTDDYDWSGQTLYISQELTAGLMVANRRAYILNGMGTGKTLATLLAIDYLIQKGEVTRALVIAPKTVLRRVWEQEVYARMPRLSTTILHGTRKQRLLGLYQAGWNVAVINPEGLKVINNALIETGFDILVVDELALYRESKTERWGLANALVDKVGYCWGLTGAPTPNGPWDIYGQVKLVTPWQVPMGFNAFRDKVAYQSYPGVYLPRKGSAEYIHRIMQPAIRYTRAEVIELPPKQVISYDCDLSHEQQVAADTLKKKLLIEYEHMVGSVKAANAAVMLGKLLQIYAGAVYTDEREVVDLNPVDRLDLTTELMSEAEGKAIVFVPYRHLCDMLMERLGLPKRAMRMVNGSTTDKVREIIFQDFQDKNSPVRYLVAHPKCMAHGLNLTAASVIVWYAPLMSHDVTAQANERITRAGQEREQVIYKLAGSAAERRIYATLDRRGSLQDTVLDLFEKQFQ